MMSGSNSRNSERKVRAEWNFRYFCERHFPQTFHQAWSQDHLKAIAKIEQAVLGGGLFALEMPRGSGKTTICETACLWALLNGHHEHTVLIGSDREQAHYMINSMSAQLGSNAHLLEDYAEIVLERRAYHYGQPNGKLVLPLIPGSKASCGAVDGAGITGAFRGITHQRADGRRVRPSLVLIDDPQTDESARSPSQCATRERTLTGAILGLAGPGREIAGVMMITRREPGDVADLILNRAEHPHWQSGP